jgi:hypothetical protein
MDGEKRRRISRQGHRGNRAWSPRRRPMPQRWPTVDSFHSTTKRDHNCWVIGGARERRCAIKCLGLLGLVSGRNGPANGWWSQNFSAWCQSDFAPEPRRHLKGPNCPPHPPVSHSFLPSNLHPSKSPLRFALLSSEIGCCGSCRAHPAMASIAQKVTSRPDRQW